MHQRFRHPLDSVAPEVVERLRKSEGAIGVSITPKVIDDARANPVLGRAISMVDQAVNRFADKLRVRGIVDASDERFAREHCEEAMRAVASLALAAEIGIEIVMRSADAFRGELAESDARWKAIVAGRLKAAEDKMAGAMEALNAGLDFVAGGEETFEGLDGAATEPEAPADDPFGPAPPEGA